MRKAWNTVLKATEKQTQARNSERSGGVRGIVDTDTPTMTAKVNLFILCVYIGNLFILCRVLRDQILSLTTVFIGHPLKLLLIFNGKKLLFFVKCPCAEITQLSSREISSTSVQRCEL